MNKDSGSPQSDVRESSSRVARRGFVLGGLAVVGVAAIGSARWFNVAAQVSGGDLTAPQNVSERYLLDLEREAFLSLAGEQKTQERIQHMLTKNKPLRN